MSEGGINLCVRAKKALRAKSTSTPLVSDAKNEKTNRKSFARALLTRV